MPAFLITTNLNLYYREEPYDPYEPDPYYKPEPQYQPVDHYQAKSNYDNEPLYEFEYEEPSYSKLEPYDYEPEPSYKVKILTDFYFMKIQDYCQFRAKSGI